MMAIVNATPRSIHAAGRRADVYGQALGYESADPWNRVGATALKPARQHYTPAIKHGRIVSALRRAIIKFVGH